MIGFSPHFVTIGNPERPIVHSRMTQLDYLPLSFGAEAQWGHNGVEYKFDHSTE